VSRQAAPSEPAPTEELLTVTLTPEIEAALLALAPLVEMVKARRRAARPVRQRVHALPERPATTPEKRTAIQNDLRRRGYR